MSLHETRSFRTPHSGDPTAFAEPVPDVIRELQTRTPKAAHRASAMDGASQSILILLRRTEINMDKLATSMWPALRAIGFAAGRYGIPASAVGSGLRPDPE